MIICSTFHLKYEIVIVLRSDKRSLFRLFTRTKLYYCKVLNTLRMPHGPFFSMHSWGKNFHENSVQKLVFLIQECLDWHKLTVCKHIYEALYAFHWQKLIRNRTIEKEVNLCVFSQMVVLTKLTHKALILKLQNPFSVYSLILIFVQIWYLWKNKYYT